MGSEYTGSTVDSSSRMFDQWKLETVIDEFLRSYVPPTHSVYVILYFQNRSILTKIFKDSARKLCNEMKVRAHEGVNFELFYGETDLWFELGHVMNNFYTLNYVFSFNIRRYFCFLSCLCS